MYSRIHMKLALEQRNLHADVFLDKFPSHRDIYISPPHKLPPIRAPTVFLSSIHLYVTRVELLTATIPKRQTIAFNIYRCTFSHRNIFFSPRFHTLPNFLRGTQRIDTVFLCLVVLRNYEMTRRI